jgi:predicted ATPase
VIARRNKTPLAPENRETAARLDQGLKASDRMLGYEVKRIGVMPVQDRLRFVLEEIEEAWRAVA